MDPNQLKEESEGRKRVLCIDDDAINRLVISNILTPLNLMVDLAPDGMSGLALFKEHPYDLVILDIMMPNMDGFETAAAMRTTSPNSPPIVLISAGVFDNLTENMKALNIDHFIPKPINKDTIKELISQLL